MQNASAVLNYMASSLGNWQNELSKLAALGSRAARIGGRCHSDDQSRPERADPERISEARR